ncbi:MAG: hypothetical protein ABIP03_06025 [Aquihabitans sp.]
MTGPKVMGLDLSLSRTGVADTDGFTAVIKPSPAKLRGGERLACLAGQLDPILILASPDLVVIEAHSNRSIGIAGKLAKAEWHGVVLERVYRTGAKVAMVPPSTLKLWATGNGSADKDQMIAFALAEGWPGGTDDEADAWHLRTAGLAHLTGNASAVRRAFLDAVDWPEVTW